MNLNYDFLTLVFWFITYCLAVITVIRNRKERALAIPLLSIELNFCWEISAVYYHRQIMHLFWLIPDIIIFVFAIRSLHKKQKGIAIVSFIMLLFCIMYIFSLQNGMLLSSFVIDVIMALDFCISIRKLHPYLRQTIGLSRLLGDLAAWIQYGSFLNAVWYMGLATFIINIFYLLYAAELSKE